MSIDIINDDLGDIENTDGKILDSDAKLIKDLIKCDSKKVTIYAHEIMNILDNTMKSCKLAKTLITKIVKIHEHNEKKSCKKKKDKLYGVMEKKKIPDKVIKYLKLPKGTLMTRNEIVSSIYKSVKDKGLCYEGDKRIFRADSELLELFNLPESVNESVNVKDKNGFNFFTLSTLLAKLYKDDMIKQKKKKEKNAKKQKKKKEKIDKTEKKNISKHI